MNFTRLSRPIFMLFAIICASCTSLSGSNFYFNGDGSELLVKSDELPLGWEVEDASSIPLRGGEQWRKTFITPNHPLKRIVSSAGVFQGEKEAQEYWELFYQGQAEFRSQKPACINPPEEYQSKIANDFKVLCIDSDGLVGIFAYDYFIVARYGNVVTTFSAVAVNEPDMTVTQASEAGVLRWTEMEALLKRIDERFEKAGKVK